MMMRNWQRYFLILIGAVLYATSLFATTITGHEKKLPDFSFVDQNNNPFTNSDLYGKVWIANFIFTRCQGMCPLLTGHMAALYEKLKDEPDIKLISFSVDPEHDTPEVLSKYAASYKAVSRKWLFVTTDKNEKMWDFVSKGFMLGAGEATAEDLKQGAEPVMHSSRFVLIDRSTQVIRYYDSDEPDQMEKLIEDVLSLRGGR